MNGDVAAFYEASRWPTWRDDTPNSGDQGFSFYPFLFADGGPMGDRARRVVPMRELWTLQWNLADQLGDMPDGGNITVRSTTDTTGQQTPPPNLFAVDQPTRAVAPHRSVPDLAPCQGDPASP